MREESGRGQFAPGRPQGGGGKSKASGRRREVSAVVLLRGVCLLAPEKGWARTRPWPAGEFSGYDAGRVETTG